MRKITLCVVGFILGIGIGIALNRYDRYMQDYAHRIEMNTLANVKTMCDRGINPHMKRQIPQLYLNDNFYWCYKAR
jgi:hypothetical protein